MISTNVCARITHLDVTRQGLQGFAVTSGQRANLLTQALHLSDAAQVIEARTGQSLAHIVHSRHRSVSEGGDPRGSSEDIDQSRGKGIHVLLNAKMAFTMQAEKCHNGICHNGSCACLSGCMDNDQIRERMKERGFNQADLAEMLGIDPTAVSKRLTGKRPFKHQEMLKIEAWLGGPKVEQSFGGQPVRMVPIIGQVTAGSWREAIQQPLGHMPAPNDVGANTFALQVQGDSMDLEIEDGGVVMVNTDDKALYPGRLFVVLNRDGETTFKQFAADPARLEPRSTNLL
jgi:repressor LexA